VATVVQLSDYLIRRDASQLMRRAAMPPDPWQSRLLRRAAHRALVTTSRQAGKSSVAGAKGLHRAHTVPDSEVVIVSPTQRQSTLLMVKIRRYVEALGLRLARDSVLSMQLVNGSTIYALPGNPDSVRGYSPNLLIIDEAAYTTEALYTACLPMLAATGGDLIAISTPNGKQGWYWAEWSGQGASGWMRVQVPYTQISRISPQFIASQRASMSRERFSTEYECAFNSSTFGLFNASDLAAALQRGPVVDGDSTLPDAAEIMRRNRERLAESEAAS
jgi:hypothetical protein